MESECATIPCVLHPPFLFLPSNPRCWDVMSRGTLTCPSPGEHDVILRGGRGLRNTACRQTWLCFPERS